MSNDKYRLKLGTKGKENRVKEVVSQRYIVASDVSGDCGYPDGHRGIFDGAVGAVRLLCGKDRRGIP